MITIDQAQVGVVETLDVANSTAHVLVESEDNPHSLHAVRHYNLVAHGFTPLAVGESPQRLIFFFLSLKQ